MPNMPLNMGGTTKRWFCTRCNHTLGTGPVQPAIARCPSCGVRFMNATVPDPGPDTSSSSNSSSSSSSGSSSDVPVWVFVVAGIVGLVVVVAVVGLVIFFACSAGPEKEARPRRRRRVRREEDYD
jgi:hypothetical protein